jgi:hypothetical protein
MALEESERSQIVDWFDSEQDYQIGVELYNRLGKNQILKKLFPTREGKFRGKLTYELSKLVGKPLQAISMVEAGGKELKPSSLPPIVLPEMKPAIDGSMPKVMARVIREYGKHYTRRSMHHNAIKAVPPDNRPENVEARKKLVDQIEVASLRMDELYLAKREFEKDGTLPDEATLFPGKVKEPNPQLSQDEIQKQLANTQKSLNKDLSLLTYQSLKKQAHPNPMPKGPKRAEIEKRVKDKRTRIANLQKQIDGAGSNE